MFLEFVLAMHLVFLAKLGHYLPLRLDPSLLLPPLVSSHQPLRLLSHYTPSLQYYQIVKEAEEDSYHSPPPSRPPLPTSDLFPPPIVPMERGGLALAFTEDVLSSLPPSEEQYTSHEMDPFSGHCAGVVGGGWSLVADNDGEAAEVVVATDLERVHEVAVLEESEAAVVLEMCQFSSVVSPPAEELRIPQVHTATGSLGVVFSGCGYIRWC